MSILEQEEEYTGARGRVYWSERKSILEQRGRVYCSKRKSILEQRGRVYCSKRKSILDQRGQVYLSKAEEYTGARRMELESSKLLEGSRE